MDTTTKVIGDPLVSIIMLTYNRAAYIGAAIESALTQTYTNFELIIIDDGSTDTTAEIVTTYTDTRIRYIKDTVNKGLFARRHESLSHVGGEFVAILDSDDLWLDPQKLEKQVQHMRAHPECAVVGTFVTLIDDKGDQLGTSTYHTTDTTIRNKILSRNQFANSSVLMRKQLLDKTVGYRDFAPAEDFELFLQLGRIGTFANLPDFTLAYRIHPGGESARKARLARKILGVINHHKDAYPGAHWARLKMYTLIVLAKLRLA